MNVKEVKLKKLDLDDVESNVNPFNKAQWYRLMKWKDARDGTGNRNLDYAFEKLSLFCGKLDLDDDTCEHVCDVYSDCISEGVLTGRSIELLMASALFVGLRLDGMVRTSSEVAEVCKVKDRDILRTSRVICKKLGVRLPLLTPNDFVPRFSEALGVGDDVVGRTYELLEDCEVAGLSNGPAPNSLCAVCLYVACVECGSRKTQRDIGEVCGVTEVTIRNHLKKLREVLGLTI